MNKRRLQDVTFFAIVGLLAVSAYAVHRIEKDPLKPCATLWSRPFSKIHIGRRRALEHSAALPLECREWHPKRLRTTGHGK